MTLRSNGTTCFRRTPVRVPFTPTASGCVRLGSASTSAPTFAETNSRRGRQALAAVTPTTTDKFGHLMNYGPLRSC